MSDLDFSTTSQDVARDLPPADLIQPAAFAGAQKILSARDFILKVPDLNYVLQLRERSRSSQHAYEYAALDYVYARVLEHIREGTVTQARNAYRGVTGDKRQYNGGSLFSLALRAECKMRGYTASKIAVFPERAMAEGVDPDKFKQFDHYGDNKERAVRDARRSNTPRTAWRKPRRHDQSRSPSARAWVPTVSIALEPEAVKRDAVVSSPLSAMEVSGGTPQFDEYEIALVARDAGSGWQVVKFLPEGTGALFLQWCKDLDNPGAES